MTLKLSDEEIDVLRRLHHAEKLDAAMLTRVPGQWAAQGLISRDSSGHLIVTKAGERRLFLQRCANLLRSIKAGECATGDPSALRWLTSSGFVSDKRSEGLRISGLGVLWLASLEDDARPHNIATSAVAVSAHPASART